ncbi:cell division protein FtsQ/DivIB [Flavihumibacter profundi]|uniref:cell division protein FtsQ/DivIB n=1 Tax=Flavihumibacter profundi TaxID=2716883 RepID=UPI001CC6F6B6|nr:cell division protein FtsQ/DivIB [Flavihumibacter profundi]MBZ5858237.1 cell division protein FtsQ/DivIB [Flavihumibacter profundi]
MSKGRINIRKILVACAWLLAGVSLLVILIAAIRKTNDASCKGAKVEINGAHNYLFIDKSDIWKLIGPNGSASFKGMPVASFDLRGMESKLRQQSWVSDAELFIDQDRVLQIRIQEREPLARVFTAAGNSYYIDSTGKYLPLAPGKPPVKLPVFTGMPEKLKIRQAADSVLLSGVKGISRIMNTDPFWMAQIAQVNLNVNQKFEIIPLIGNHIILFGDGENIENKFNKLQIFYKQVLSKTGFDYYQAIDVQFDKQVIGIKGNTISTSVDKKIVWRNFADTSLLVNSNVQNLAVTASPISQSERKPGPDPSPVQTNTGKQPKAVMKKKL